MSNPAADAIGSAGVQRTRLSENAPAFKKEESGWPFESTDQNRDSPSASRSCETPA